MACSTTTVVSGDSCGSLASRCGISAADFTLWNPSPTLCSSLAAGQLVCCNAGSLPNLAPSQNGNGSCATYNVVSGDSCSAIAAPYGLTVDLLESFNTQTWGWSGCSNLQAGSIMCTSIGAPPMPAPVTGAICGPQVPGTRAPPAEADISLASLNPCPLNACCDIWGQCGTTTEFCTITNSSTGAPGTAAPGTNGCISNCGTDIAVGPPPIGQMKVGYFEGWSAQRSCLQMDVSQVDETAYTHLHFAFASLANDTFAVDITSDIQSQFTNFVALKTTMKKILSFGGWTFSTAPFDYSIFRNGMSAANRDAMAAGIASFIVNNNLDGVDIDWEYPGAPDIPGIPPGSPDDGPNYLAFLISLRKQLPAGKTISISAPSSFWYLQHFPISQMSTVVDYIVYMTYDLHGQWDYGNANSDPGCPGGNCLRSHVNITETINSLSMITKAGVPTNKIVVGVSSYGRSFQMTDPGCAGPMCTYTGPDSGAQPAPCTNTSGYIANAEINMVISVNPSLQQFHDADSDSDILVYNSDQWVAYMSDTTKQNRTNLYLGYNFAGTSDWAVDLQKQYPSINSTGSSPDLDALGYIDPTIQYCNDSQAKTAHEAWVDAGTLAKLHLQWSPEGKWQNVMDLYMGNGSRNDWDGGHDTRGPIGDNIARDYAVHYATRGIEPPFWTYAWIYCDDPPEIKKSICHPEWKDKTKPRPVPPIAYSWDQPGTFWSAHYITLCDGFFKKPAISLADITEQADGNINFQNTLDNWYNVQGNTILHETYHWEKTVSIPRCNDTAYPAQDVADLAYWNGSDVARLNAESYADCAVSIYIMDTWGHVDPPTPNGGAYVPGPAPKTLTDSDSDALSSPPDGWISPVPTNSPTFKWDPSLPDIIVMSSLGDIQDDSTKSMECHEGDQFGTLVQCNIFCPGPATNCSSSVDANGRTWYGCSGCPNPTACTNGNYPDLRQCKLNCNGPGGKCTQTPGFMAAVCSGCGANICRAGTYENLDVCQDKCGPGMCNEDAGVTGIICTC